MGTRADVKKENKRKYVLADFSGGMRTNIDPSNLEENEYARMLNGRNRSGGIKPSNNPLDLSHLLPAGKLQGVYGYDTVLVVFNNGRAYVYDFSGIAAGFALIADLTMDSLVDTIYAELVPASWMNMQRKNTALDDVGGRINFFSEVFGTPASLVVQDGLNQPWLLFSGGSAREAHRIDDWENIELTDQDTREYVPIGKQMIFSSDGRFYIVSPEQREIYRAVTGRPLDFVVAITTTGDKLPPLSSGKPEAARLSYKLNFDPITCIAAIPSTPREANEEAGFFVSTLKKSWIVYPTYRNTVFGEPVFSNSGLFSTGALNQFSITDILGDIAIITESGITSFNSVLAASNEGKNAPFHDEIHALFDGITQVTTCAITSDNYALFGVDTIYGRGILVYDTLRQRYTSFDLYSSLQGYVKQFAEIKVNGRRRLFFITTGNQLMEFNAGTTANCQVYFKEFVTDESETELIPRRIRLTFDSVEESGTLTVTPFADGKAGITVSQQITATSPVATFPIQFPFGMNSAPSSYNKTVTIEKPIRGQTIGLLVSFNFRAELLQVELVTEDDMQAVTNYEQGRVFNAARTL